MTRLVPGDTLDCLGPLGEPFVTSENMLLVGGGVGIAPMLCIASHLQKGESAQVILGFRNKKRNLLGRFVQGYTGTGSYHNRLMVV